MADQWYHVAETRSNKEVPGLVQLVECIPNFSEGRSADTLDALSALARSIPGVTLLDVSADPSHNRSVYTLAGDPRGVSEAAFALCALAAERIDLRLHSGVHPRMGATDVIPFVPIRNMTMEECVALSRAVAERIGRELNIPVFLYEASADHPARKNLADIRRGQFEGMPEKLRMPDWTPDFGGKLLHPTAGVVAVGARRPLIAFNVNLSTSDLSVAKDIARAVRGSSGGFQHCKAMGVLLQERGIAQVSMNMTDYERTPLFLVYDAIAALAAQRGVSVLGSEIVGLAPAGAFVGCAAHYLRLECADPGGLVLENHLPSG